MTEVIDTLREPWTFEFMQRALIVAAIMGAVSAVVGSFVILKGMAFLGDALPHASVGGVALAFVLGANLQLGAAVAFYLMYAAGIVYFAVLPALSSGGVRTALFCWLQARANEAASTLNKSSAALVEVSLNGGNNQLFRGAMASMAMDSMESMAVPVAEPGTTQVNLTVSARALLSP